MSALGADAARTANGDDSAGEPIDLRAVEELFGEVSARAIAVLTRFPPSTDTALDALRACLDAADARGAGRAAHGLKGSAQLAGAGRLGEHFQFMETALRSGDLDAARVRMAAMEREYARVRARIDQLARDFAVL